MPAISEETERAIRAFAAYFGIRDEGMIKFWLRQWELSGPLNKTKPKKNESN